MLHASAKQGLLRWDGAVAVLLHLHLIYCCGRRQSAWSPSTAVRAKEGTTAYHYHQAGTAWVAALMGDSDIRNGFAVCAALPVAVCHIYVPFFDSPCWRMVWLGRLRTVCFAQPGYALLGVLVVRRLF
jgi:hypothetical protein